jgi:plasmid maintenance system antidote protein VapI
VANATGAVYSFTSASIKTMAESLEGARDSYQKMLEGQRKFTAEEYAQFASLRGFDASKWMKTG